MYKEYEKVFYVDDFNGVVKESKIMEIEKDGLWIKIKGESMNTFVHTEMFDKTVYQQSDDAEAELCKIRAEMKTRLLQNNLFINDVCERLEHHEGKLYADIIKEILQEEK